MSSHESYTPRPARASRRPARWSRRLPLLLAAFLSAAPPGRTEPGATPPALPSVSLGGTRKVADWEGLTKKPERKLRYFLPTGFTFPARLENAIYSYNSETPAIVLVERHIEYLERIVIPAGTRLIGAVSVVKSHDRVLIRFQTMVFPEGDEIALTAIALSLDGSAGIKGKVEKHKDAAVANTVLRSIVAGTQVALDATMVNPVAASAAQGVSQEALQSLELERQQVTTSISVDAETGVRVYLARRIEY